MTRKLLLISGIGLVALILYQFYIIEFDRSSYNETKEKAEQILAEQNVQYTEENLEELTEALWTKESKDKLRAVKIRKFADELSDEDKRLLLEKLKYQTFEENPSKILEITTIKKGYSIVNFVNEKIFGLTSVRQVNFQKNYFIIIVASFTLLILLVLWFFMKRKKVEISSE